MFFVIGCAGITAPGENVDSNAGSAVKYVHDDEHNVGCWLFLDVSGGQGSISCLPDNTYTVGD